MNLSNFDYSSMPLAEKRAILQMLLHDDSIKIKKQKWVALNKTVNGKTVYVKITNSGKIALNGVNAKQIDIDPRELSAILLNAEQIGKFVLDNASEMARLQELSVKTKASEAN